MPIITLTSDWGITDHYAGAVRGAICQQIPGAIIADISHEIQPFNLNQAAFILRNAYRHFPPGTIHLVEVCSEASIETPHVLVIKDGHYFLGADNGIFSLVFDGPPDKVIELEVIQDSDYFTFPSRDLFVKVAAHVARGDDPDQLGNPRKEMVRKITFKPVIDGNLVKGTVIYLDNYENAFTNITEEFFRSVVKGRKFVITFRSSAYRITEISRSYKDVVEGEMLALFSTTGHLEIAINQGRAGSLLGLRVDTPVLIEILE